MDREEIKALFVDLPEVSAWPEMANIFDRVLARSFRDCEWPQIACQAVGGDDSAVAPAAAAMVCMKIGITMADDILDEDPRGLYHKLGTGVAANLALAFQAAAFHVIANSSVDAERRAAALAELAQMALTTALGQNFDVQNLSGEENYWHVIRTKSTPYYAAALHIGAMLAKADPMLAQRLHKFGVLTGEIIQVHDDITDALEQPANPDWKRGHNNLLILYALTADHSDREKFQALLSQIDDTDALRAAQQILIRCGALSYSVYHIAQRCQTARQLIASTPFTDPSPLHRLLAWYATPLVVLLKNVGAQVPPELETI